MTTNKWERHSAATVQFSIDVVPGRIDDDPLSQDGMRALLLRGLNGMKKYLNAHRGVSIDFDIESIVPTDDTGMQIVVGLDEEPIDSPDGEDDGCEGGGRLED